MALPFRTSRPGFLHLPAPRTLDRPRGPSGILPVDIHTNQIISIHVIANMLDKRANPGLTQASGSETAVTRSLARVDHLAGAVRDRENFERFLVEAFGFASSPIGENASLGIRFAFLKERTSRWS